MSYRCESFSARRLSPSLTLGLVLLAGGCGRPEPAALSTETAAEPWAVTAWGRTYEIFPETGPLVAGRAAESHTHVTTLADFSPLSSGNVAIVLRGAGGGEEVFGASQAKRPGIFAIEVVPRAAGEYELLFRIDAAAGREEIPGGRVRVGDAAAPGGLLAPPPATARAAAAAAAAGGEEISFLKEQQWKTPFATAWTAEGELAATRKAPGRVIARAGGDRAVTAPADGLLAAAPFPYPGLRLAAGAPLFALTPRLDNERSLAEREGGLAAAEAELAFAAAEERRARRLAAEGVLPAAEQERSAAALAVATAREEAARRDVDTARRSRGGSGKNAESLAIGAPFAGTVAEVAVSPGQAVAAGDPLGRFVAAGPPWIEAWLPPEAAAGLAAGAATRLSLATGGGAPPPEWIGLPARLVALGPTLDAATGRRSLLLELQAEPPGLAIGQSVEVEFTTGALRRGIVVPAEALVDDFGVTVVYLQVEGETLHRREVEVLARAGNLRLVGGLAAGERLVVRGGAAVRRSTLISTGAGEGHVH
jgi:cobalt-zinc-cadmium efflux system membrane fusion protein